MNPLAPKASRRPGPMEMLAGYAVLLILGAAACGVLWASFELNPAVEVYLGQKASPSGGKLLDLAAFSPPKLAPASPAQEYGPDDLYEKINGKADLYLRAGFKRLTARRFALKDAPALWAEIFLYEMASPQGSQGVMSVQRRSQARPLDFSPLAYRTENAVYLVRGKSYVELVGSAPDPRLLRALEDWAHSFAAQSKVEVTSAPLSEAALFPLRGLLPNSITRSVGGALGFPGYAGVWTARYLSGSIQMVAYLSLRQTPEHAAALSRAYVDFILGNGGKELPPPSRLDKARAAELFGQLELVLVRGRALLGVSAPGKGEQALELLRRIDQRLAEKLR